MTDTEAARRWREEQWEREWGGKKMTDTEQSAAATLRDPGGRTGTWVSQEPRPRTRKGPGTC